MKSWSVRREPNSALSWQAYDEAQLSHWHMSLLEELMPAKGGHLAEVQCLLPLASQREEKRGQERKVGGRDKRVNSRPPRVVCFFQRPCWGNCFWQGCDVRGQPKSPSPKVPIVVGQSEMRIAQGDTNC